MNSRKSEEVIYLIVALRIPIVCSSLTDIIVDLGVLRVSFPRAHEISGSVGAASAEPPPEGVREPQETRQLSGGPPEGGLQQIPFSWHPWDPSGVDRLTDYYYYYYHYYYYYYYY